MESFGHRLKAALKRHRFTVNSFATASGIPASTLYSIVRDEKKPTRDTEDKIFAHLPELRPGGQSAGAIKEETHATAALAISKNDRVSFVPEYLQGGLAAGFSDNEFLRSLPEFLLPGLGLGPGQHFCFPVRGTSMQGTIDPGDLFVGQLVEDRFAIRPGEIYAVWMDDGSVVKRVWLGKAGELELRSDNPQYGPYTVRREDVRIMLRFEMKLSFSSSNGNVAFGEIERLQLQLAEMAERLQAFAQSQVIA